ncbi:metallophosphoesterase family protein [Mesorhizobium xinjiangense]|uniref:metallophosphoesterase family protein n=1 Tax=Mesorhizobium xinjiangense TaxID=2678685 RepID=UPI0012ED63BE|nr:metallophosphoesterase [Mesorhizobium xinjiangense]
MSRPVHFVHLTDLHLSHPDHRDPELLSDTLGTLKTVKAMVRAVRPRPAFILISGDLTNRGDAKSYRLLAETMDGIDIPIVYALGNHDSRPGFYEGMLGRDCNLEAPYCHDTVIDDLHVVVLDSRVPGRIGGALSSDQFDFLQSALDRHTGLRKIIAIHHPPALDEDATLAWECLDWADSRRLAGLLKGRDVAGVFSGHVHYDRVTFWHGMPVVVGTGLHTANDILYADGLRMVSGASFGLCTLRESGLTVSFVPLPSDRHELQTLDLKTLRALI